MIDLQALYNEINWPFIDAQLIRSAFRKFQNPDKIRLIRSFIIDGVPIRFQNKPFVYEKMRDIIAKSGLINQNDIRIVGSSKQGYSLSPHKFGERFTDDSDFDLLLVSERLFLGLVDEYQLWLRNLYDAQIMPKDQRECVRWIRNIKLLHDSITCGYINHWYLPPATNYKLTSSLNWKREDIANRMQIDRNKISFRVYKNWKSVEMNLMHSLSFLSR